MVLQEQKSPEELKSVWPKYGLKESPFMTTPTRLLGVLPIEKVFSGREEETKKLMKIVVSSNSSRTLVIGDFGVGKTTFVNYVKWCLCMREKLRSRYVTPSSEIKIQPEWDATQFLLATLSSIYNASIIFKWKEEGMDLRIVKKIEEYVAIGTQKAMQGTVGVFGAGYSETKSIPSAISPEIYETLLNDFCSELINNGKQLILTYDNLENIEVNRLADFFKTIKDYIQIEGIHSIFVGPPQCLSALEKHTQVHSVFTQPIVLGPLTSQNVLDILKKRCETLKLKEGDYIPPYDEDTVKSMYERLNNIRFTFKVLEDTTIFSEKQAPCKITMTDIKAVQDKEKKEILSRLTTQETKIISTLMGINEKINLSKLSKLTKIGTTNLRNPLTNLESKGLITIISSEEDKRIKYARLSDNTYLRLFYAFLYFI